MKTFKTIRPYAPAPFKVPTDDGFSVAPTMGNYLRVPATTHVIQEGLKWWQSACAINGMSANPLNPDVRVLEMTDWLVFYLDDSVGFYLDRNSSDLSCYARQGVASTKMGTLTQLIEKWKQQSKGNPPHVTASERKILFPNSK